VERKINNIDKWCCSCSVCQRLVLAHKSHLLQHRTSHSPFCFLLFSAGFEGVSSVFATDSFQVGAEGPYLLVLSDSMTGWMSSVTGWTGSVPVNENATRSSSDGRVDGRHRKLTRNSVPINVIMSAIHTAPNFCFGDDFIQLFSIRLLNKVLFYF
jgi:hypothetical protein